MAAGEEETGGVRQLPQTGDQDLAVGHRLQVVHDDQVGLGLEKGLELGLLLREGLAGQVRTVQLGGELVQQRLEGQGGFLVDESGDVSQPLTADGLVKAAVYASCRSSGSTVFRHFNRVNGQAITIADGTSAGHCALTFNFDLSNRFWVAMPAYTGGARTVSCEIDAGDNQKLNCARFDVNGNGVNGPIMVLVY